MKNRYEINGDTVTIFFNKKYEGDLVILIDKEDFDKVDAQDGTWYLRSMKYKYAQRTVYKGKIDGVHRYTTIKLHNVVMDCPKGMIVDHINHNTLDNRKSNLRIVEQNKNLKHRSGKNSNNKSGYRNVSWVNNKWVVQLQVNGKRTILGKFDDVHEAGKFAEEMRKKYYGEFAGKS